jgi:hypothetical protein
MLSLTPGSGDKGHYTIYIMASDPAGLQDALEVNIEVIGPDATDTRHSESGF